MASTAFVAATVPKPAQAAQTLRFSTDDHGDMVVFGNTLGHDCSKITVVPLPIVGTVGACGTAGVPTNDSAIDVFWRSDSPAGGQAEANLSVTPLRARSQALLQLPVGATVLYARLYWQGQRVMGSDQVLFERPNVFSKTVTKDAVRGTLTSLNNELNTVFSSTADVTPLVQQYGAGAYRISVLQQEAIQDVTDNATIANWYVVVFYRLNNQPTRNLTLFDGFDLVSTANPMQTVTLSGFLVPNTGFSARLAVITQDGDSILSGDQVSFNGTVLSDAQNPANNFVNGTRSYLGAALTVPGDLPQYSGLPGSMNGIDLDTLDVTAQVKAGDKTATITASTSQDQFWLNSFVTSISTVKPVFSETNKTVKNLTRNDGSVKIGDTLEYTIVTQNTGSDTGINVTVTDPLPTQLAYVAGSITIDGTAKTDQAGDDQAELTTVGMQQTLVARIGPGANAATGGTIKVGDTPITIKFRATVKASVTGLVSNQAVVSSAGQVATMQGLPTATTWNSGDGKNPNLPTNVMVGDPTDLQVTVKDDLNGSLPVPGTPIVYTVDVKNLGPRDVTGGSVVALLPQLATGVMVTWTCNPMGGGVCPAASGTGPIDTTMLNLPNGANITYTITVPNTVINPVVNPVVTVAVQPPATIPDVKQDNNTASTGAADLSIKVTDNLNGMAVKPNTPSIFTVTVDNKGPSGAQNVLLSDSLPPGVAAAGVTWSCTATGGAVCPAASGTGALPSNGGSLPRNGQLVYAVNVPGQAAPTAGTFIYQVSVNARSPLSDPDLSNNSASSAATPTTADLTVQLTRDPQNAGPGDVTTYTLLATNKGSDTANNVVVTLSVPPDSEIVQTAVGEGWTCTQNLNSFTCSRPTLAVSDAPPVTVKVRLPGLSGDSVILGLGGASATVTAGNNNDPNPADNTITLAGTMYKLKGGGVGCSAAGPYGTAPGALAGLLLSALFLLGRRRSRSLRAHAQN